MNARLSHIEYGPGPDGAETPVAAMVDVGEKVPTRRMARAGARVRLPPEILEILEDGDLPSPKGPVFQTAVLAGIGAAKRTWELIPLCHPLALDHCDVRVRLDREAGEVVIECTVRAYQRTGAEMEALTGASVAALTVYDMCKARSPRMAIVEVRLLEKTGGKRDFRA